MSRKWSPSRGWEPLTDEQLASLTLARERFAETCTWAHYIDRMSPERLAQQRAYDRERGRTYYQEHKESIAQYSKDRYEKLKQQLCENHACEVCGGRYTIRKKAQHCTTKKHQHAMAGQGM
jgi:hypothetical protein